MIKKQEFIPKWIAWEVTGKCNLNCIHCRSSSTMETEQGSFATKEAFKLIDDIVSFCSPVLVLSGGEPLLRGDLFDIAKYGTEKGLRVCIATNGLLIDGEICEKMKKSGIKMVSLSLDGSSPEIHDSFRNQEGSFEGVVKAARILKENGIPFLINSSFTKRNQHDIKNVYKLAKRLGATAWYLFMIVPTGRGEEILSELIPPKEYDEILEWHFNQELVENEILMRPTCAPHYYRIALEKKRKGIDYKRRTLKFSTGGSKGCLAAQLIALIDRHGEVQPCSYFPRSAGNVKKQHFKDIWFNSSLFKDLRDFESYKGRCGACEYLNVCGGCRARAEVYYGSYMDEEPFCDYVPYRMRKAKQSVRKLHVS